MSDVFGDQRSEVIAPAMPLAGDMSTRDLKRPVPVAADWAGDLGTRSDLRSFTQTYMCVL